jgi:hypothetical protein
MFVVWKSRVQPRCPAFGHGVIKVSEIDAKYSRRRKPLTYMGVGVALAIEKHTFATSSTSPRENNGRN